MFKRRSAPVILGAEAITYLRELGVKVDEISEQTGIPREDIWGCIVHAKNSGIDYKKLTRLLMLLDRKLDEILCDGYAALEWQARKNAEVSYKVELLGLMGTKL